MILLREVGSLQAEKPIIHRFLRTTIPQVILIVVLDMDLREVLARVVAGVMIVHLDIGSLQVGIVIHQILIPILQEDIQGEQERHTPEAVAQDRELMAGDMILQETMLVEAMEDTILQVVM